MYDYIYNIVVDKLSAKNYSYSELRALLFDTLESFSAALGVGRVDIELDIKDNIYSNELKTDYNQFEFSSYLYDPLVVECPLSYGICSLKFFPRKKFSSEQVIYIKRILFIFLKTLSVTKLNDIVKETPFIDPLTSKDNTAGFHRTLLEYDRKHELSKYSVIFFNIKSFKSVNKKLNSFQLGSEVLKTFVEKISLSLGIGERICRHGGDNFSLICKNENVEKMLDILKCVTVHYKNGVTNYDFALDSVIGYYRIKEDDDVNNILQNANTAMVIARQKKIPVLEFDDDLKFMLKSKQMIINDFENAMYNKKIVPFYQPKVNINDKSICGSEALIRWFVRDDQLLSPSEFLPVLEEYNLACEADFFILNKVCMNLREALKAGLDPVKVSVNFGRNHFDYDSQFEDRIIKTINMYGLDPSLIEVEITESGLYNNLARIKECVFKLQSNGISVSIDDYGTGYSSLKLLEKVNFDVVKIDKSFADDIGTKVGDIVFKSTADLLHKLNKNVVCEGIETEQQIDFLRKIGCDVVQGYYYDRPLSNQEYTKRLTMKYYK